jgi:hypothetical protein
MYTGSGFTKKIGKYRTKELPDKYIILYLYFLSLLKQADYIAVV